MRGTNAETTPEHGLSVGYGLAVAAALAYSLRRG